MSNKVLLTSVIATVIAFSGLSPAHADAAKPGQSMTHLKTASGLASTLESVGVILYAQGGATASLIGDSVSTVNSQYVVHIPVTSEKSGVQHLGSNIVLFNTTNNTQLQLRNPVIDLKSGAISATLPQVENKTLPVFTITNLNTLKSQTSSDRKSKLKKVQYSGANLAFAPGIAAAVANTLGLPANSIADQSAFGSADITLYSKLVK